MSSQIVAHSRGRALRVTVGVLGAVTLGLGLSVPAAMADEITSGHLDVFAAMPDGDRNVKLMLLDDRLGAVDPAKHVIKAIGACNESVKKVSFVGKPAYLLPLTQDSKLPWPGSTTLELNPKVFKYLDFEILEVDAPKNGKVYTFSQDFVGNPVSVMKSKKYEFAAGEVIDSEGHLRHTHYHWVFTEPGTYRTTVKAVGKRQDGSTVATTPKTYTWEIVADPACTPEEKPQPKPDKPAQPGTTQPDKETNTQPPLTTAPLTQPAKPLKQAPSPKQPVNQPKQPANTGNRAVDNTCYPVKVPGAASAKRSIWGGVTIPAHTHVHPNWVFTKPGRYMVNLQLDATGKDGKALRAHTNLHFNVGGSGSANSGHFDLGAQMVQGRLVPSLKNDNVSPAAWVNPSSVSFGVGANAVAKAPAGIEFIAKPGEKIWMIGSTQVANVPWLGANTMHESMAATTGSLRMTITGFSGPGELAVFTSGNFGKVVGQKWFGVSRGGAGVAIQGRTKDGRPCTLGANGGNGLAATGAPIGKALAVFALGVGVLGAGVIALNRTSPKRGN